MEELEQVRSAGAGREAVGRSAVRAGEVRISAVVEQQLGELCAAARSGRGPDSRYFVAVVVPVAARIGAGLEQQPHRLLVVVADRSGQRVAKLCGTREVREQQLQKLMAV